MPFSVFNFSKNFGKLELASPNIASTNSCIFYAFQNKVRLASTNLFSKHQPSGPMLSISQNVRLSVCVCVCSLLRYRINVFLPPLPEVGCQIFLEIRNPWGKVMERSGLRFEHFCLKVVYNRFFLLILPYKTWWKPRFPMDQRPLVKGRIANFGISLDVLSFCILDDFFRFSKNLVFGYSWSTWKPPFPMDQRPLVEGRIANFGIFLEVFEFLRFG